MNHCLCCGEPIRPGEEQPGCAPGVHWHRICGDIAVASLAEDLKAWARTPDSGLEELPDGRFREKES